MEETKKEFNKSGLTMLLIQCVVRAIKENDEEFFNSEVGDIYVSLVEESTGITVKQMCKWLKEQTQSLAECTELITDSESLTAKQLAEKYKHSVSSINSFLRYRNLKPKAAVRSKDGSSKEIIEKIKAFNGELTTSELASKLGLSIKKVYNLCYKYKLPYKRIK